MQPLNEPKAKSALPIIVLEFGFHQIAADVTISVAQAITNKFNVLASDKVEWEKSECDGSPSIRFDLKHAPWMLDSQAFKPTIDAMYKEVVQLIEDMAEGNRIATKFRCLSVDFADAPSVCADVEQIFDLDL